MQNSTSKLKKIDQNKFIYKRFAAQKSATRTSAASITITVTIISAALMSTIQFSQISQPCIQDIIATIILSNFVNSKYTKTN